MREHIDTHGLSFTFQFLGILTGLLLVAYGGGKIVGAMVFGNESLLSAAGSRFSEDVGEHVIPIEADVAVTTATASPPYVSQKGSCIVIDTSADTLTLYKDAVEITRYNIIYTDNAEDTISALDGNDGLYGVRIKSDGVVVSQTDIIIPYNLQFYNALSIHGQPYHKNGAPIDDTSRDLAGGGVQLSTSDAEELYSNVAIGTPVFVISGVKSGQQAQTLLDVKTSRVPATSARAFLVADLSTGQIYLEKRAEQSVPIASVTKLMTALVANELLPFNSYITYQDNGQEYYEGDMLYPLFLRSDNSAAESLAAAYGRQSFISQMNAKAKVLNMSHTHYDDPSGLSSGNISNTIDLYHLVRYLYLKKRFLLNITRVKSKNIVARDAIHWHMDNQNLFAGDERFIGGKLGFTDEALQTSAAIFSVDIGSEKRALAVIVLGSYDWKQDTRTLLTWVNDSIVQATTTPSE